MSPAWVRDLSPYHRQCIRDIGIRVFCVYRLVMLVVSGTCVLLEISNSVCTKYNEPTLLHATIYICQQDKYKVDVCMQRSAIGLSKENLYALP